MVVKILLIIRNLKEKSYRKQYLIHCASGIVVKILLIFTCRSPSRCAARPAVDPHPKISWEAGPTGSPYRWQAAAELKS